MAKYGIGESVRFRAPELLVSTGGYSVKIDTDGLVGRVTCSIETTGEETKYCVEVKLPRGLPMSASGILGISDPDVTLKLTVLEGQIQGEKEYSWIRSFLNNSDPCVKKSKKSFDATINLKKWKPIHSFFFSDFAFPMAKDIIEEYEKKFNENARNIMKGVDSAVPGGDMNGAWGEFGKMSKSRCVKLLESYRAEREKVKNGRKFERCLRDSVVDEALERAIELLKGGAE